jgi:hypothetical protein
MANLSISGRMSVKGLKKSFKKEYGLSLRVYKGKKFADEDATLASLSDKKVTEFSAKSNMLVGNFEKKLNDATGLNVQVSSPKDKELCGDSRTLAEARDLYKDPKYKHL